MAKEETPEQRLKRQLEEIKLKERLANATMNHEAAMASEAVALERYINQSRAYGDVSEEKIQQLEKELKLRYELVSAEHDALQELINGTQAQKADLEARLERIDALEKEIGLLRTGAGEFDNWANKTAALAGIGMKFTQTWSGGLFNIGSKIKIVQKEFALMKARGVKTGDAVSKAMASIGDSMAGWMVEWMETIISQQDQLTAGFYKATQASDEMASSALRASEALRAQGLGMEASYTAIQALITSSVAFKNSTGDYRDEIIDTVAKLEIAGVSANTTAAAFDVFTKVLGKKGTAELKKFATVAETLDVPLNEFYSEFVTASKQLASRGPQMEKVFINLQAQVRATGASMDTLLQVANRFDTFDSSAEAVARLNGILGGPYLNSIEMVMMKEDERIEAVRASLKQSGTVFKNLGHHAQMSIMAAAGITDQAEANKLLGSSASEYKKIQKEAEIAAEKEKNLAEMTEKAMTMANEIKFAFMSLVIEMQPMIESVKNAITSFTEFVRGMDDGAQSTFFWSMIMGGLALKFAGVISAVWKLSTVMVTALAPAFTTVGIAMKLAGFGVLLTILAGVIWAVTELGKLWGWWGNEAEEAGKKANASLNSFDSLGASEKVSKKQFDERWKSMHDGGPVEEDGLHNLQKGEYVVSADKVKSATNTTMDKGIVEGMGKAAKGDKALLSSIVEPLLTRISAVTGNDWNKQRPGGNTPMQIVLKLNGRDLGSVLFDYPNGVMYSNNDTGKALDLALSRITK